MSRVAFAAFLLGAFVTLPSEHARANPSAAAPTGTNVEASVLVPQAQDSCLDHTVKELGMSAKKVDKERRWEIQARFLHSAVADGVFGIRMEPTDKGTRVAVQAGWAGAPKDKDTQLEIEERLRLMTAKMAQMCGVVRADVSCTVTAPGAKPAACAPTPAR